MTQAHLPRPFRVVDKTRDLRDTVTLVLEPSDGGPPLDFAPGQFTMMYVFGVGEIPISISGDASDRGPLVHTIRSVGRVSDALCALDVGAHVGIRGPFGVPWPVERAVGGDVLIVAGGLGLAPVRPILYHVLNNRLEFGHVGLLYGTRTPEDLLFRPELESWRSHLDFDLYVSVDHASPEWRGHVGVVTMLLDKVTFEPRETHAFVCGPEIMMRILSRELVMRGVPAEQVFVSMERNMQCAVGLCGHCQYGADFVCTDGPVFDFAAIRHRMTLREV